MSGLGVFLPTLILYLATSYPTVAYIDSGELALVAQTLGIAHPTGYPLYTLVGRLFSLLPLELMTAETLLGTICTATAVTVILWIVCSLIGIRFDSHEEDAVGKKSHPKSWDMRPIVAALVTLVFAVSPLAWSQGVTNEVYALHLLFLSLLLLLILKPYSHRRLIIGGYLMGLSFSNHLSTVLVVPVAIAYLIINRKAVLVSTLPILRAIGAGLLGASIYFYLPIRASLDPMFNWGHPTTWESFVRHVSGWQYQVWMFNRTGAELLEQLGKFAGILFDQFPLPFWLCIAAGFYYGFKTRRQTAIYLALLLIVNLIYALNFSIPDIDNYLLPATVTLFLFAAIGIEELRRRVSVPMIVPPAVVAALIVWGLLVNWGTSNQSRNTGALDGVHNYYASVDQDALILSADWDYVSPWYYSRYALGERPEVLMVDAELIRRSWYFDWIRHADPQLHDFIKPEIDAFLPHVRQFERGEHYDNEKIERSYRAILRKLIGYPNRKVYFDQSVKLGFTPPGEVVVSGQLYRTVRRDETFQPPTASLTVPNFGKSLDNLTWREKWHMQEFEQMRQASRSTTGR